MPKYGRSSPRITAEVLCERIHYDPETGVFRRLTMPSANAGIGRTPDGYQRFMVQGCSATGGVWAWLYMTGDWPAEKMEIDHINGDCGDDRWANLRMVPHVINLQNKHGAYRGSASGVMGVSHRGRKFYAQIQAFGVRYRLGSFDDAETAHAVYLAARRRLLPGNTL